MILYSTPHKKTHDLLTLMAMFWVFKASIFGDVTKVLNLSSGQDLKASQTFKRKVATTRLDISR